MSHRRPIGSGEYERAPRATVFQGLVVPIFLDKTAMMATPQFKVGRKREGNGNMVERLYAIIFTKVWCLKIVTLIMRF